jgi:hypothetical protein
MCDPSTRPIFPLGRGTIKFDNNEIIDVYLIPEMKNNLLSMTQKTKRGLEIRLEKEKMIVIFPDRTKYESLLTLSLVFRHKVGTQI